MKKAIGFIAKEVGMFTLFAIATASIVTTIDMKKGGRL